MKLLGFFYAKYFFVKKKEKLYNLTFYLSKEKKCLQLVLKFEI
ncbi:hypothetical protein Fleli_1699 [Bernardetia litoralis DSM 6794]|uniref:Uncharacterized protein n=1 Tax=Bernardetia litoralis (strain ATCC 23117 / DSM 6794 / NBRC 15988 / NCIMB 1366 / Fx l1 / Sio-4) TaxID=880071 RepID=I4AJH2_BERLS|nr:hypothetical protein Fleli_1699 [Bernardetia litoralis DSM 6794]